MAAAVALLLWASSSSVSPIHGRSCGAVPTSCAPGCANAIVTALKDCAAGGGGTVSLASGTYHLNDSNWVADGQPMLILRGLHNVTLAGQAGSGDYYGREIDPTATTLLIYGLRGAFSLSNCSNVHITGLQIDMERQPYTYGRCVAADKGSFTVKFDPEAYPFPAPVPASFLKVQSVMGFDPVNWRMARNAVDIYTTANPYPAALLGGGSGKPSLLKINGGGTAMNIRVGEWYVLRHMVYGPGGVAASGSSNLRVEDVQLYSIPGMGFVMSKTKDVHLKNCGTRFRGRTQRPMSITADASHFDECSGTVHLEGVHFEGQGDDGSNVHGMFHDVRQLHAGISPRCSRALSGCWPVQADPARCEICEGRNQQELRRAGCTERNIEDFCEGGLFNVTVPGATSTFELGSRPAGGTSAMNLGGRYEFRNRDTWAIEGVGELDAIIRLISYHSRMGL